MTPLLIRILIILILLAGLTFIPWPDIPAGVSSIIFASMVWIWGLNPYIPIDLFMSVGFVIFGIEVGMVLYRWVGRLFGFVGGQKSPIENIGKKE